MTACEIKQKCIETNQILRQQLKNELLDACEFMDVELKLDKSSRMFTEQLDILREEIKSESEEEKVIEETKRTKNRTIHRQPILRRKPKAEDFRCFFCDKNFEKISLKNQHVKFEHALELLCKVCNIKKPSSTSTEKCLRDHQLGFDFLCQICAKPFRHKYYLLKHQATFHAESDSAEFFSCDYCGLQTKYKMNLCRHVKSVHLKNHNFPCPHPEICPNVTYTTKEGLSIHLYRVHGLKAPVTCTSCNLGFSFISELKIHRKICGGTTRTGSGLGTKNRNFKQFCEVVDEGFKCKVCSKIFTEKQNWSYHYSSTHRDNRTCEICNKEFTNYTNFYRHVNVQHRKIKKFKCDFLNCEKSFGQKGSLMNHKNTHTGEKPFSCLFCSFRSGDKSSVIKHKKKMHNQQQLLCS